MDHSQYDKRNYPIVAVREDEIASIFDCED